MKVKLKDAFDLQIGRTPARSNAANWNGQYKWISITDLGTAGKYISTTKEKITDKGIDESGIKIVPKGTVVMSFKLSIGKTAITTEDMYTNEAIVAFNVRESIQVDSSYLYYLCCGNDWGEGTNKAVMGLTLNKATLSEKEIELPEIMIQREVAKKLDKLDKIIIQRKKQLQKLDELIQARFVEMFGDPVINSKNLRTMALKDVLRLKAGDFTAASDISDKLTETNKYPCFGGNGIRGYVTEYNQEGEYSLIGRQGALSGNVQFAKGKFRNTEHALLVIPMVEMNDIWLNQLLINLDLKRYQTGAAQPGLSVKNLQEISIIMVPITEQNQFADFVNQVNKSKVEIQQALEKTQLLFDSLMQQYFG